MSSWSIKLHEIARDAMRLGSWSQRLDRAFCRAPLSRSPISHPLFLASLALLIVNDHVLKHVDLLPNAVTGKLSDFAGLIVAPIVLSELLGAKSRRSRALCFAIVAVIFSAINLSVDMARAFERATALIGMPWSVFVDASDLIGLVVYPIAWSIGRGDGPPNRATLAIASLACAASSPGIGWNTSAYVINRTERPIEVRVRWAEASLDCDAIGGNVGEVFAPELFGEVVTFELLPDNSLPLEKVNAAPEPPDDPFERIGPKPCEAALLKIDGAPDTIVYWRSRGSTLVPQVVEEKDEDDLRFDISGMLVLEENDDGVLELRPHEALELATPVSAIEDPKCVEATPRFEWSTIEDPFEGELIAVEEGADGCFGLEFDGRGRIYVCADGVKLPFVPGDVLAVSSSESVDSRVLTMTRVTEGSVTELGVFSGRINFSPIRLNATELESCGRRLACGSYAVPVSLVAKVEDPSLTIGFGTAEHLIAVADDCDAMRDSAGVVADLFWVKQEEK